MGANARFKNGDARVETRVLKTLASRLSFLPQNPRTPEGFQKGSRRVSEGVSEGFSKGFRRALERGSRRILQNAFKNPSKTLQESVEIDDALGFPGL